MNADPDPQPWFRLRSENIYNNQNILGRSPEIDWNYRYRISFFFIVMSDITFLQQFFLV